ncbi:MAG: Fic family protein [Candidatus Krumholzibacteriia bacterium]
MPTSLPHRLQAAYLRAQDAARQTVLGPGTLSRADREMLTAAGLLRPVMRGWSILAEVRLGLALPPDPAVDLQLFLAAYLDRRCRDGWCLCPLSSLQFLLEPTTLPDRVTVLAAGGGATVQRLIGLTRLVVRPDPDALPAHLEVHRGIRAMAPETALPRIRGRQWLDHRPLLSRAVLAVGDWPGLTRTLIEGGLATAAGHIHALLGEAGRPDQAADLARNLGRAGLVIDAARRPGRPTGQPGRTPPPTPAELLAARLADWADDLDRHLPRDPVARPALVQHLAATADRMVDDTWHSLRLAGLGVDRELVRALAERRQGATARSPLWPAADPVARITRGETFAALPGDTDPVVLVSVQGHLDALDLARMMVLDLMQGADADLSRDRLRRLYLVLMRPWAQAGLMPARSLRRYRERAGAVFPADWIPPAPRDVAPCLEALRGWHAARPCDAAVRAAAVHLGLLWIQPWMRGNGRMARLVQNVLQAGAGQPWRTIPGDRRADYLAAAAAALQTGDCRGFCGLFAGGE